MCIDPPLVIFECNVYDVYKNLSGMTFWSRKKPCIDDLAFSHFYKLFSYIKFCFLFYSSIKFSDTRRKLVFIVIGPKPRNFLNILLNIKIDEVKIKYGSNMLEKISATTFFSSFNKFILTCSCSLRFISF